MNRAEVTVAHYNDNVLGEVHSDRGPLGNEREVRFVSVELLEDHDNAVKVWLDKHDDYMVFVNPPHYAPHPQGEEDVDGVRYTYDPVAAMADLLRRNGL